MVHAPRLRLSYSFSRLAALWPFLRRLTAFGLLVALVIGAVRWVQNYEIAGALEFTPRVIINSEDAVGVEGMVMADTDNDGDIDIVTAGLDGVKIYVNNGSESFEPKIVDTVRGERIQVIDFNGDGNLDLLVTIPDGNPGVKWYDSHGDNEFAKNQLSIPDGKKAQAYAGDIDGDNQADIVTATEEGEAIVLRRWMNNSGTFTPTVLNADSKVSTVTIGDINSNGYKDIVTGGTNGLQRWDTGNGVTWSRVDIDDSKPNRTHIVITDVDGDEKIDIVTGDQVGNVVAVYTNQDNSTWERNELSGDADVSTVAVQDLDEDGKTDILVAAQDDNSVFWFKNDGKQNFTKETIISSLQSVFAVAVADLDDDNDFDFIANDHFRGRIYWYQRTVTKPVATAPGSIQQSTDGIGKITFKTTVSDGDGDPMSIRVQYSRDGKTWYKPWLTKVTPSVGSVDLKNSLGYQIGTNNPIDTNSNDSVGLTMVWDTKSTENTGGPIVGDVKDIRLRIIPRDKRGTGVAVVSDTFRVDNQAPTGVNGLKITSVDTTLVNLNWNKPTDSTSVSYRVYLGTDASAVAEQRSETWDKTDDTDLDTIDTLDTSITGLENETTYNFKLVARDAFGNEAASSTVRAKTQEALLTGSSTPIPTGSDTTSSPVPTANTSELPSVSPIITPTPTPTPVPTPASVLQDNQAPQAEAGPDQVVNPSALVILDGSSSSDPDRDTLTFTWRQVSGLPVVLRSEKTATPSFSAGDENSVYIFSLTVRDSRGATSFDNVTIATREIPLTSATPVEINKGESLNVEEEAPGNLLTRILRPLNMLLASLAVASTGLLIAERMSQLFSQRRLKSVFVPPSLERSLEQGRVVHYQTGMPVAGAQVLIYDQDNKLRMTEKTNAQGLFPTSFPAGSYSIGIEAPGFLMASTGGLALRSGGGLVYTGGQIKIENANKPLPIIIPLKPTAQEISSLKTKFLHWWQALQRIGRALSWPLFISGALLNTILVFIDPSFTHLAIEVLYIALIIIKIAVEIRIRPAYGLVRDTITHVPLDLAVVRLVDAKTNRLVMTRVTNNQGKFFALPPAGAYTVSITKQGYGTFTKNNIEITDEHDATLQMTADLMPIVPHGGLQQARGAVL